MVFNSAGFLLFFPFVVILYFAIPKKYRSIWLLLASYYFYMSSNAWYGILLLGVTIVTYFTALQLDRSKNKKIWFTLGLLCSLGLLGTLKYCDFTSNFILPIGISFYVFQSTGYVIDVYRGKIKAETNFFQYALFVAFFPSLISGPIERAGNLLWQIKNGTDFDYDNAKNGLLLMMWGLFEKIVIADGLAVLVDEVFSNYVAYSGVMIVLATMVYSIQIYCDFDGYSNMAIGAAQVLGFHLHANFQQPYMALNIKEFWKRWHISLSSWLRDYIYIPLGGSRCSKLQKYRNLIITFLISGLWHGAGWNYVVWGGLHGIYQVFSDATALGRSRVRTFIRLDNTKSWYRFLQSCMTFLLVTVAWFVFRIDNMQTGVEMIQIIVTRFDIASITSIQSMLIEIFGKWGLIQTACAVGVLVVVDILHHSGIRIRNSLAGKHIVMRWTVYLLAMTVLLIAVIQDYGEEASTFIYFQF